MKKTFNSQEIVTAFYLTQTFAFVNGTLCRQYPDGHCEEVVLSEVKEHLKHFVSVELIPGTIVFLIKRLLPFTILSVVAALIIKGMVL